jgi:hypothetical protein
MSIGAITSIKNVFIVTSTDLKTLISHIIMQRMGNICITSINASPVKNQMMEYSNKRKKRSVFTAGKFYHTDTLDQELTGNVIRSMFRKPLIGEKLPDGVLCKTDMQSDCSDYNMCIASFAITISILFNNPE